MHQCVHCENGSDEIDEYLLEGETVAHHHLFHQQTNCESEPNLVDHPNATRDAVHVAFHVLVA